MTRSRRQKSAATNQTHPPNAPREKGTERDSPWQEKGEGGLEEGRKLSAAPSGDGGLGREEPPPPPTPLPSHHATGPKKREMGKAVPKDNPRNPKNFGRILTRHNQNVSLQFLQRNPQNPTRVVKKKPKFLGKLDFITKRGNFCIGCWPNFLGTSSIFEHA